MKLPSNIDEVIAHLDDIIATETAAKSTLVFFPVLYRKVTERIKLGIQNKEFEDNPRMERLDVIFASRYIEAYEQFKAGQKTTESWQVAFDAAQKKLIIMQHLLLGINAHINLDLGISVAETVGERGDMEAIKNDYNKINEILASMVSGVEKSIGEVSPVFYLLEKIGKGREDKIVSFSIDIARDEAWAFANQFHVSINKPETIAKRDAIIAILGNKLITSKSRILRWVIRFIRFFESKNISRIVTILEG
ncbi:MAG: hypothetical protein JKY22_10715 [Flavobacteriaceae bacterium]|nr:hypothetical protein [Flavobacteriaceae bacterium]